MHIRARKYNLYLKGAPYPSLAECQEHEHLVKGLTLRIAGNTLTHEQLVVLIPLLQMRATGEYQRDSSFNSDALFVLLFFKLPLKHMDSVFFGFHRKSRAFLRALNPDMPDEAFEGPDDEDADDSTPEGASAEDEFEDVEAELEEEPALA